MKNIIRSIIEKDVPSNHIFDTHSIVLNLLQTPAYKILSNAVSCNQDLNLREIASIVASFEGELVVKMGNGWSKNINGIFSKCTCWRKI